MKKAVRLLLFLSVVIGILAALIFYAGRGPQGLKVEDALSAEPEFYIRFIDLEKDLAKFQEIDFFKKLKAVDAASWTQGFQPAGQGAAVFAGAVKQVFSQENIEAVLKLFGREAAVAYYTPEVVWGGTFSQASVLPNFSIVTRLDADAQIFEALLGAASAAGIGISRFSEPYRGKTIHLIRVEGGVPLSIGYIRFGDLLVLGVGDAAAKRAIDRVVYGSPALAQDDAFREMRARNIADAHQEGFFHYDVFAERMVNMRPAVYSREGEPVDDGIQRDIAQGFKGMEGFTVFYFSSKYARSIQSRLDMTYDMSRVSEHLRAMVEKAQSRNRSLAFVPQTAVLYSWNAFFAPKFYWDRFVKGTPQEGAAPRIFGIEMDDVMAVLTDEVGWYFFNMDLAGRTPLPQGVIFLGVRDPERMSALIRDSLETKGAWRVKTEFYKGREIVSLENFGLLDGLEPSYCFIQNYFLLAVNRDLIYQSIDVYENRERSMEERAFIREIRSAVTGKGSAFLWGNISALVEEASGFLKWGNSWADIQYFRQQALRTGAQQRLGSLEQEIVQKQKELDALEGQVEGARSRKEALLAGLDQTGGVEREIDRRRRILENAQGALKTVVEEQEQLLATTKDETMQLTAEGRRLLAELQEDILRRRQRIEDMQRGISLLQERQERIREQERQMREIEEEIADDEQALDSGRRQIVQLRETRTEVEYIIAGYGQPDLPMPEQRSLFLEGLIGPILEVLSQIQELVFQSEAVDGGMRSEIFLKVK